MLECSSMISPNPGLFVTHLRDDFVNPETFDKVLGLCVAVFFFIVCSQSSAENTLLRSLLVVSLVFSSKSKEVWRANFFSFFMIFLEDIMEVLPILVDLSAITTS